MLHAAHHFPNPARFIAEVARVLTPNGKFILIDNVVPDDKQLAAFINTFEKLRDDSHVRCLSMNEWLHLLKVNQLCPLIKG
ncbi:class I SAM-dependent methyltransferase [bacterium LRH843]|nr:class I SAM-dependent methyltransferase [bacterium LRH843]